MNQLPPDVAPLDDDSDEDPFLGTLVGGRYEMLELVGGGGIGLVYKAFDRESQRTVAVKVLFPQMAPKPEVVSRFKQEARTSSLLAHQNIVSIVGFDADKSQSYLAMEFIDGVAASDYVEQHGRMTLDHAIAVMLQACDGIQHAHARSVVHRDLKPSNLMLANDNGKEVVKIVDFGLAKAFRDETTSASKLTKTGDVCGSPSYMSPEQCRGVKLDYRTDLFSLGCVFYELLTGHPPFYGEDPIETILKQISETPAEVKLEGVDPQLVSKVNAVLFKALAKDRERRYQSIQEMRADIENILAQKAGLLELPLLKLRVASLKFQGKSDKLPSKKALAIALPVAVLASSIIPMYLLLSPKPGKDAFNKPISWQTTKEKPSEEKAPERIKFTEFLISRFEEGAGSNSELVMNALAERIGYFKRTMQFEQEQRDLEKLLKIRRSVDGPTSVITATTYIELADCLYDEGKLALALPGYRLAIPILAQTFGKDYADLARPLTRSGTISLTLGQFDAAESDLSKAIAVLTARHKMDSLEFAESISGLAETYRLQTRYDIAADTFQRAAQLWNKFAGAEKQNATTCYVHEGDVLAKLNKWGSASEAYQSAIDNMESTGETDAAQFASIQDRLANAQWRAGKFIHAFQTRLRSKTGAAKAKTKL
jgi:serine/threonine protein kinase